MSQTLLHKKSLLALGIGVGAGFVLQGYMMLINAI